MDDLQLVRKRLSDTAISALDSLSKKSGVPFGTLQKIKYGTTKNPRWETVVQLASFYRRQPKKPQGAA